MKYPYEAYKGFSGMFGISGFLLGVASGLMQPFQVILIIISIIGFVISSLGLIWTRDACEKAGMVVWGKHHPGRFVLAVMILIFSLWVCSHEMNHLFESFYCGVAVALVLYLNGPYAPKEKDR